MKVAVENKKVVVKEISEKIANSKSTTIIHYHGFSVENLNELKMQLRSEDVKLKVYKNTLIRRALGELDIKGLDSTLTGPNALVFSNSDEISGPRVLAKFMRKHKNLVLKSAILDNKVISQTDLQILATLPSKDGLISMFASAIISPLINVALAIKAISEKQAVA